MRWQPGGGEASRGADCLSLRFPSAIIDGGRREGNGSERDGHVDPDGTPGVVAYGGTSA